MNVNSRPDSSVSHKRGNQSPPGPSFLGRDDSGSGSAGFTASSPLGRSTSGILPSS